MINEFQELNNYPSFTITNGMILQEVMMEKNISFTDLFQILGPKAVVMEIIQGKRSLKLSQMKRLSELFGMDQEVFQPENSSVEGKLENIDLENNMESNHLSLQDDGHYDENHINSFGEENNNNQFGEASDSQNGMKPFWED